MCGNVKVANENEPFAVPFTYLSLGRAGEWRRQKICFNWTHYRKIKKGRQK